MSLPFHSRNYTAAYIKAGKKLVFVVAYLSSVNSYNHYRYIRRLCVRLLALKIVNIYGISDHDLFANKHFKIEETELAVRTTQFISAVRFYKRRMKYCENLHENQSVYYICFAQPINQNCFYKTKYTPHVSVFTKEIY